MHQVCFQILPVLLKFQFLPPPLLLYIRMIVHLIANCSSLDASSPSWSPEEVYDEVLKVQQSLEVRQSLLHAKQDWNHLVERWETQPLAAINVADLQKQINNFLHTLDYLEKGICLCM